MADTIRIVVADDHPLFRKGVVDSLTAEDDCTVVAEASTGEQAVELVANVLPDLVLLDVSMPGIGGIEAARRISAMNPAPCILMLTVSESERDLLAAIKAGAKGYVLKGVPAHRLGHAVRALMSGEAYVSPSIASTILYELTHEKPPDPVSELTEREYEVLQLVGEGLTNREIGERLFLAEKTVKHYMTGVLQKLQVRSRVEAALVAERHRQVRS